MCAPKIKGAFQRARPTLDKAPNLFGDALEKTLDKETFNGQQCLVHMSGFVGFVWMHSFYLNVCVMEWIVVEIS